MAYIDLSSLKSYLGITATGDDALLTALIARAQSTIDNMTGRTFEAASDTTRYFDAIRDVGNALGDTTYRRVKLGYGRTLFFDTDICQITSVTNGDGTTVAASLYTTEPRNDAPYYAIRLKDNANIDWTYSDSPENAIIVVGRWAHSITPPPGIVHVCAEIASLFYKQRDTNSDILRPIIAGNATLLPAGLSAQSREIINSYRRIE